MIVCVCNAKNDRAVREVLCGGQISTPAGVHRAMGCKPQCGRCLPHLASLIDEARTNLSADNALQAAG
jgi:bacterioferritin-associated ferredoxin